MTRGSRQWSLATRLTVLSSACAFGLLLAAALFLHWELSNSLQRDAEDRLRHKVQVLARLIAEEPPNVQGIRQEAHEEAEVSSESDYPFYLRVLDGAGEWWSAATTWAGCCRWRNSPAPPARCHATGVPRQGSAT
jgi:hypothetical protein